MFDSAQSTCVTDELRCCVLCCVHCELASCAKNAIKSSLAQIKTMRHIYQFYQGRGSTECSCGAAAAISFIQLLRLSTVQHCSSMSHCNRPSTAQHVVAVVCCLHSHSQATSERLYRYPEERIKLSLSLKCLCRLTIKKTHFVIVACNKKLSCRKRTKELQTKL